MSEQENVLALAPADGPQFLTQDDLAALNLAQLKNENRRLNQKIMELDAQCFSLQSDVSKWRGEVVRHRLLIMKQEHADLDKAHAKWFKEVKQKYGLPDDDSIGFHPDTGEIKTGPKKS